MACFVVVPSLLCLVWGGRTLTGAMDWTAQASGADQSSSLLFSPERPQAAKSANMVRTVRICSGNSADGPLSGE